MYVASSSLWLFVVHAYMYTLNALLARRRPRVIVVRWFVLCLSVYSESAHLAVIALRDILVPMHV